MKILKTLSLSLCLVCTPVNFCASSSSSDIEHLSVEQTHTSSTIFTKTDSDLAKLYPGTLKGYEVVASDEGVVSIAQKFIWDNVDTWKTLNNQEIKDLRAYYFNKFFAFMNGLKEKCEDNSSSEFNKLFSNIWKEAKEAQSRDLTDLNWHMIEIMFLRGLLLVSDEGNEAAQDLLSNVPDTELFFGALRDTPAYLVEEPGQPSLPAWKHSAKACLHNMKLIDTRGKAIKKPYVKAYPLDWETVDIVERTARGCGLPENAYIPMVGQGKIGITTIVKMWLRHVLPIPLTYGEYEAHGIKLGAAVGAQHDTSHGDVDNRNREVHQAIVNLLNKAFQAKKPVRKAIPLAAKLMVARYRMFNEVLLAFIEAKEHIAINELQEAIDLSPNNKYDLFRIGGEDKARRKYNAGVAALFQVLHEKYAFRANVLEASTFEEAIKQLCDNAVSHEEEKAKFDEFETLFNPRSDLTDAEIFERVKDRTLESVGVYPIYDSSMQWPKNVRDYLGYLDVGSLQVNRGPVFTEVVFETFDGKRANVLVPTARYSVNTLRDENAVLGLVGKKVPDLTLDFDVLAALPKDNSQRVEALAQAKNWFNAVVANTNEMVSGLVADISTHVPIDVVNRYNALVAVQNAEWKAAYPVQQTADISLDSANEAK